MGPSPPHSSWPSRLPSLPSQLGAPGAPAVAQSRQFSPQFWHCPAGQRRRAATARDILRSQHHAFPLLRAGQSLILRARPTDSRMGKILVESYFINLRSAIPKWIGRWTPTKMVINHFSNFLGVYMGGCYGWFELLRCPSTQSIRIGHQVRLPTATGHLSLLQKDYPECTSFQ